jgi:rod shape-determining protein MreD
VKLTRFPIVALICLWLSAALQETIAPKLAILDAAPDFLLVSVSCLGLLTARYGATLVGFLAGLLNGALAGANLASYAISRTFSGFLVGWFNSFELESNIMVAFATTFVATLAANLVFMFITGPSGLVAYLLGTVGTALYNGLIAVPIYLLLRWAVGPESK